MYLEFFLLSIFLFAITYFAVRLAINPLLRNQDEIATVTDTDKQISELVKLRDMDIFDNDELELVIKQYQNKNDKKDYKGIDYGDYKKYAEILNELKTVDHFITAEQYFDKIDKLKEYFEVH